MNLFIGAALTAIALTYESMWLARQFGILDQPGELKIHVRPTPRFGGLGIAGTALLWMLWEHQLLPLAAAGLALIAVVGALDDKFALAPRQKLLGQLAAAALLGISLLRSGGLWLGTAAFAFAVILSNSVNLLDGMDGLAAGSTLVSCAGLSWLAYRVGLDPAPMLICAGALAGFLVWNYPRAKTFMGDVGSLSVGYLLAQFLGTLGERGAGPMLLGLAMVSLPLFDTALGIVRRLLKGRPIFAGDRDHFYDQIQRRTRNPVATLWIVLAASAGVVGFAAALPPSARAGVSALGALGAIYAIIAWRMGFVRGSE